MTERQNLSVQTCRDGDLRRERIVEAIATFIADKGYSPTVRELTVSCGLASPGTTVAHLRRLAADGRVAWLPKQPRTIRLLSPTA